PASPPRLPYTTLFRSEEVPEVEEVHGGHSLQDLDLVDEQALDGDDPAQPADDRPHVLLVDGGLGQQLHDRVELPCDLLEPQFVGDRKSTRLNSSHVKI